MSEQTLQLATVFPDGTEVGLYDALGFSAFPPSGPPGSPLQMKTIAAGKATFTELVDNTTYFVAAKVTVDEVTSWRNVRFVHNSENPPDWYGSGVSKGELTAHEVDTTSVHGIADTAALATKAEVETKQDASTAATDAELSAHAADTTGVHGIADTAALALKSEVATDAELAAHVADTTAVHGITDTSKLALKSDLVFNVKDYGAVGDGVTDDSEALENARTALEAAGGGVLYLPPGGEYVGSVKLLANVHGLLWGYGAKLLPPAASVGLYIETANGNEVPGWTIQGLAIDGQVSKASGIAGIKIVNSDFIALRDVRIDRCQVGLELQAQGEWWVEFTELTHVYINDCDTGISINKTGVGRSFGETMMSQVGINNCTTGLLLADDCSFYRSVIDGLIIWLMSAPQTGVKIAGDMEGVRSHIGFENFSETACKGVEIQATAVNVAKWFCQSVYTGEFSSKGVKATSAIAEDFYWAETPTISFKVDSGGISEVVDGGVSLAEVEEEVATHSADTTSVHGIADTSALALKSEVATDGELSAHEADTTSVHGISNTANLATKSEVEPKASKSELEAHLTDTVDAHDASAVSYAGGTGMSATDAEAAIDELATEKLDKVALHLFPVGFSIIDEVKVRTYRGLYVPEAAGETITLVGMWYSVGSGTNAKFSVYQQGVAVTDFKEKTATTSTGEVSGKSVAITTGDRFDLVVESISATPKDLIVTLFFQSTH